MEKEKLRKKKKNIYMHDNDVIEYFAYKCFSPRKTKRVEIVLEKDLLTVRVYKKNGLDGWFSIIEIKRFYEYCQKDNNISFRYPWEITSLDLENKDFIEIHYHLK